MSPYTLEKPRVLLVDDRPENLLALEAVLETLPCELDSVTSGEEALKAMLNRDYAVVLLDVQMPGMDGFETAELIKGRERSRTVPIIFVTAISKERRHVFRGYETGAVDYVFKPYDPPVLRSKVAVFLELDAKSRGAAASEAVVRATFDSAPVGMARLDGEGRIAEVNRALCDLLGDEPALLRDRMFDSHWHPEDAGSDADRRAALLAGGIARYEHEIRLIHTSGEVIPCQVSFSRVEFRPGVAPGVIAGVQDLRDRRRAEAERDQLIREQAARAQAEELAERLAAVQSITEASLRAASFEPLVKDLLTRTVEVLGADTAAIVLDDGGEEGEGCVYQLAPGMDVQTRARSEAPVLTEVASVREAPLRGDAGYLGSLHIGTIFPRRFTSADEAMLRLAADRAGQAIERVRLFERERAIAEELQRSLLPESLPVVPGLAIAARYFAAGPLSQVGGDWYDTVTQPHGRLLLIVGDVAGRGIKAASAMGQLRSALRAYAVDGHSPAALLHRMNSFQVGMRPRGMATLILVQIDYERGQLTYAKAGHPPGLLICPEGQTRWLDEALGPPLGAVDAPVYSESVVDLTPGTTLVLYTDGLVEQRGEPLDSGLARLAEAVMGAPAQVGALVDHVVEQTMTHHQVDDDVTVLALRTAEVGADATLPGGAQAPGLARAHVRQRLSGVLDSRRLSEVSLAVSELVANAFLHGGAGDGDTVHLTIEEAGDDIHFRVSESSRSGNGVPVLQDFEPTRTGGMGLQIVNALADEWGVSSDAATEVWFRIARGD